MAVDDVVVVLSIVVGREVGGGVGVAEFSCWLQNPIIEHHLVILTDIEK